MKYQARVLLILSSLLLLTAHDVLAQSDLRGRWGCNFYLSGSSYPQDLDLSQSGATLSGKEYYAQTQTAFANITGAVTGSSFVMKFVYTSQSYSVDLQGTASGDSISGNWQSSSEQVGNFICNRSSGVRGAKVSLFCNRIGVNLTTARCTATVGDVGAPPRTTPTGSVDFTSRDGFIPGAASCVLQQTAYSPGVAACDAEFQVPFGFPVGAPFPIDAEYNGSSNFGGGSTSHQLIQAGCVGTPDKPCSGAVALGFADVPKIAKGILAAIVACGGSAPVSKLSAFDDFVQARSTKQQGGTCNVTVKASMSAGRALAEIKDQAAFKGVGDELAKGIGAQAYSLDDRAFVDGVINAARSPEVHERVQHLRVNGAPAQSIGDEIDAAIDQYANDFIEKWRKDHAAKLMEPRAKRKKLSTQIVSERTLSVSSNKQKDVKLKLNKSFGIMVNALRSVNVTYVPVQFTVSSSRTGSVPAGAKRKVKFSESVSAVIAQ